MGDADTALEQLEAVEDAYTRWMLSRAIGNLDLEHREAQRLSSALFAMFDGGPEADDEPCAIKRALQSQRED
ncbi:MAG: hypothetical protein Unbinned3138contig1000_55 [Prokaryotic dsDNA virus sp.]|nr:MAG: hypothetical protein Unbinned3138contig1000_55 [Prokaryotic dsDNA virus sp.]|tara:strand:- start:19465 stop:19680 length:216 start_codon:yes stop_codon:yes gene_type:complete